MPKKSPLDHNHSQIVSYQPSCLRSYRFWNIDSAQNKDSKRNVCSITKRGLLHIAVYSLQSTILNHSSTSFTLAMCDTKKQ